MTEIESLRQQLAEAQAKIEGLNGRFEKDQDRITYQAQQLAECQAANAKLEAEKEYRYVEQILRPIKILIALAQSAETLADNSEEIDEKSCSRNAVRL